MNKTSNFCQIWTCFALFYVSRCIRNMRLWAMVQIQVFSNFWKIKMMFPYFLAYLKYGSVTFAWCCFYAQLQIAGFQANVPKLPDFEFDKFLPPYHSKLAECKWNSKISQIRTKIRYLIKDLRKSEKVANLVAKMLFFLEHIFFSGWMPSFFAKHQKVVNFAKLNILLTRVLFRKKNDFFFLKGIFNRTRERKTCPSLPAVMFFCFSKSFEFF